MPFRIPPPEPPDPPPEPDPVQLALWWPILRAHCAVSTWDRFTRSLTAHHFPIPKQGV